MNSWIEERCDSGYGLRAVASELYGDFKAWAYNTGEDSLKQADFNKALDDLKFRSKHTNIGKVWDGLKLRVA